MPAASSRCQERGLLPHGKVMIHDPLTTGIGGSALTIDSLSRNLMQTRQITAEILARHTGRTLDEIYACTDRECLQTNDKIKE